MTATVECNVSAPDLVLWHPVVPYVNFIAFRNDLTPSGACRLLNTLQSAGNVCLNADTATHGMTIRQTILGRGSMADATAQGCLSISGTAVRLTATHHTGHLPALSVEALDIAAILPASGFFRGLQ